MNLVCRVYKPTTFLPQLVVSECFSNDRMMGLHFLLVCFVRPTSEEARGAWWCMGTMGTKTFTVGSFGLHPRTRPNGKRNYGGIWWWYVVVINGSASSCCNVFQAAKTDESYDLLHLQCVELLAKVFSKLLQWSSSIISSALVPHISGLCVHGLQTGVQTCLTFNPVIWLRQYVLCKPHSIGLAKFDKDMNDMNEHMELICNSPIWTWFAAFTNQPLVWGNSLFFNWSNDGLALPLGLLRSSHLWRSSWCMMVHGNHGN